MLGDVMAVPGFGSLHALSPAASMDIVQSVTIGLIMEALTTELVNEGNKVFTILLFLCLFILRSTIVSCATYYIKSSLLNLSRDC